MIAVQWRPIGADRWQWWSSGVPEATARRWFGDALASMLGGAIVEKATQATGMVQWRATREAAS